MGVRGLALGMGVSPRELQPLHHGYQWAWSRSGTLYRVQDVPNQEGIAQGRGVGQGRGRDA